MKTTKFVSLIITFLIIISCNKQLENPDSLLRDQIMTSDTIYINKGRMNTTKGYDFYHELMTYNYSDGTWFASWGLSYLNNTRLTFSGPAPEDIDPWEQPYFELISVQNGSGSWIGNNSWSITYNIAPIVSTNIPVRTEQTTIHKWELGQEIIYDILIHYRYTYSFPSFVTYNSSFKIYKLYGEYYLVNIDFTTFSPEE